MNKIMNENKIQQKKPTPTRFQDLDFGQGHT